jgi:transposase-like protein
MACEQRQPGWHKNPAALKTEYALHGTFDEIARHHGGSPTTYSKWWRRLELGELPPGAKPQAEQQVELDVQTLGDVAVLLRERGLDPDEWVVIRCVVNTWGPEAEQSKQLKVTLRPRLDALLRPAASNGKPPAKLGTPSRKKLERTNPRLVVFVGDEQAPYHDPDLHRLFCEWLAENKPDEAVHLGDLMDLPTLSRHRPNPAWNASPQECIQAGYDILAAYREASPSTRWTALPGNHDERIRDYQLQRAPELFGVRPADLDERELAAAVQSLPSLLHLPRLGVDWAGGDADYEQSAVDVSPQLTARHGWITGGNSAEKTVRRLGLNVVVGHTHRQRIHYITEERMRTRLTLVCVEAGCMCLIEGGLGYTVNPDWQAGFASAHLWPDGRFTIDHGVYRDGVLTWRDQRYADRAASRSAA